jgi:hypothetical protein
LIYCALLPTGPLKAVGFNMRQIINTKARMGAGYSSSLAKKETGAGANLEMATFEGKV